jgi:hypothetical protein
MIIICPDSGFTSLPRPIEVLNLLDDNSSTLGPSGARGLPLDGWPPNPGGSPWIHSMGSFLAVFFNFGGIGLVCIEV